MIPSIPYFITGYRTLATDGEHAAPLLELCRRHDLVYEDFRHTEGGGISLRFPLSAARRVSALCGEYGIPLHICGEGGLPRLLRRLGHRAGLLVGLTLGILLLTTAQSVVWDIRISGNEQVSDRSVAESLASCGFTVGTSLRGFEADVVENNVLMLDDRLAWLSINRKGTVAYVEVREKTNRPASDEQAPCDMVAAYGGVIERVELEAGNIRVSAGQIVGEGEVLVSGLYDSNQLGIRYTAAKARVYARTTRVLTVKIPLSYEQKVYETDLYTTNQDICQEKSLIFFGNHIKFSKKTGNMGAFCDTIESEKSWGLTDGVGFPISVHTVWYIPYTVTAATRTPAEAEELAYFELAKQIAALPGGAELIGKTITVYHGTDVLTLTCTLTCIEDIATKRVIEIGE
ncbi:MAG: sporulation protein YqfD [Clostridia bacterium]|nr:sporulation protein YqfD [Clostridia bacterium]